MLRPVPTVGGGRRKHHPLDLQEESSGVALLLWQQCKPAFAGEQFASGFAVVLFAGNIYICVYIFFFYNGSALTEAGSQPACTALAWPLDVETHYLSYLQFKINLKTHTYYQFVIILMLVEK